MPCKITLIGAGSVVFAKTLIGDILQFPELADVTICLMDIDTARLKVADVMMRRMAKKLGAPCRIESTTDRREAVRGAKYVICTVQVGGYKPSTVRDFEIPKKYGLRQTIGDTLGIGGIFRGLRTIPVLLDLARDIADVADPECLLLNYSNPMAMNCWAIDRAVGIPHVGLCHSVFGTARMLATHAGLPFDDINYLVAGVNHMAFFLKFEYRGADAYPLLFRVLKDPDRAFERVRYEMMRRTGYFVTESSEHQAEYTPYFIQHGAEMIERFNVPIDDYLRRCETIAATWAATEAKLIGEDGGIEVAPQSHEYGSYIIHSLETNTPRTIYGNVPNRGLIDNLPDGCCIEIPCLVDGNGLQPVKIGALPLQLAGLCRTNTNVQDLTVEAALSGRRESIYHAAMLDPHTSATLPLDRIWALCDELIEAHQADGYLGEFAPVIKNTGRAFAGLGDRVIVRALPRGLRLDEAGSEFELELTVENPGDEECTADLRLTPEHEAIAFPGNETLRLVAAPGQTTKHVVRGEVRSAVTESVRVGLRAAQARVLAIGAVLMPRRRLVIGEEGAAPFALELAGFPCARGTIRRDGDRLRLEMTVDDSDPKPRADSPWMGSCVELFFAEETRAGITQLFVVPGEGSEAKIVDLSRHPVEGATLDLERGAAGYHFRLDLPTARAGIGVDGAFLFDVFISLNALGDAHSGGRSSLSGKFESNVDMAYAVEVSL